MCGFQERFGAKGKPSRMEGSINLPGRWRQGKVNGELVNSCLQFRSQRWAMYVSGILAETSSSVPLSLEAQTTDKLK